MFSFSAYSILVNRQWFIPESEKETFILTFWTFLNEFQNQNQKWIESSSDSRDENNILDPYILMNAYNGHRNLENGLIPRLTFWTMASLNKQ